MKKLIKALVLAGTVLAATHTLAVDIKNQTVTEVYLNSSGQLLYKLADHSPTASMGCTKNTWYEFKTDQTWLKELMHKQLLTARISGAHTWIRISGCDYWPQTTIVTVR